MLIVGESIRIPRKKGRELITDIAEKLHLNAKFKPNNEKQGSFEKMKIE